MPADRGTGRSTALMERRLLSGFRTALLMVALTVQFGLSLPPLLQRNDWESGDWPEIVAFTLLALVGAGAASVVVRRVDPPASVRWLGVAILLVSSGLVAAALPPEPVPRVEHWCFGQVGWYGLVLLFDVRLAVVSAFFAAHLVLTMSEVALVGAPAPDVASMAISAVSVVGLQLGVALAAGVVRRIARAATESSLAQQSLRIEEATAILVHRDRERRFAHVLETAVPLLEALATGALDPTGEETRRRCAMEAVRMRRLFAENDDVSDRLLHELRAVIDVTERHGPPVQLAVRGGPCQLDDDVRRELLEPIAEVLLVATSAARVTVLRWPTQVRVSVVAEVEKVPSSPDGGLRHVRVERVVRGRALWMEASWGSTV